MALFYVKKRKELIIIASLKDIICTGVIRCLNKVYASEFIGKLTGNADTATSATKATQDESGNNIKSSYASSISISDHTITLKNKNGSSLGTVTVPDNNTVYTHPTTSGNKHIPSGGSSGQILRWSADGTAVWGAENSSKTPSINEIGSTSLNPGCYVYPMKELHIQKYLNVTKTITITQYVSRGYATDVYYNYVKLRLNLYGYGMYEGELMCVMGGSETSGVTGKLGGTLSQATQYGKFTWSSTSLSSNAAASGGYITHTIKVAPNSPIDIIYSGDSTVSVEIS